MTLQGFHLASSTRAFLLSLLILLSLNSHAQTVTESMALFDDGKTKEAVAQLTKLAQQGDPEAQNLLGVLYDNGQVSRKTINQREPGLKKQPRAVMPVLSTIWASCSKQAGASPTATNKRCTGTV